MKTFRKLLTVFRRKKIDADMTEEMRLHLEQRERENLANGMSPDEARYAAYRKFGGVEQAKERAREQRAGLWFEQVGQDVRHAARALRKNPGFATVVIVTLALGIGANTAIFSVVNALMLRALPVADPGRLVQFQSVNGDESFSYPTFQRLRSETRTMTGIAMLQRTPDKRAAIATGFGSRDAEPALTQAVSGSLFGVLGVSAALGRTLSAEDDGASQPSAVTVLSHAYWQRRYGGSPAVLGKAIEVDGVMLTIVGVMAEGFTGFRVGVQPDLWWPMELFPQFERNPEAKNRLTERTREWGLIIGRLGADLSRAQAAAELQTLFYRERSDIVARATDWTEAQRRNFLARTLELVPGGNGFTPLRENLVRPLTILGVIVGLVLLVACANVAGLLLARGATRQRELAVRAALGAGRGRIVQQLVTESLLLASLGGAAGFVVAQAGTALLGRYLLSLNGALDLSPDGRMLGFAVAVSVLTGGLFGVVPALRLSRGALQVTAKAAVAGGRSRLNQALVVAQIALSVALLATAGLFVRSLQNLRTTDLGFRPENVVRFALEFGRDTSAQKRAEVHRRVMDAVAALPTVRSATVSGAGLFGGDGFVERFGVEGHIAEPGDDLRALVVVAGPRFFETLGIPLRVGRGFTIADETPLLPNGPSFPRVAVIGETLARDYFGDVNPVGRTLRFGPDAQQPPLEIIGVAKDVKYRTLRERVSPEIYVPYFGGVMSLPMVVQAATQGDPRALEASIRSVVREIDVRVVVTELGTMQELVDRALIHERMVAQFGGFFSGFALLLACLGLYGVLSYGVVQRTREIGVRMALGARAPDVLALVVGEGVKLAVVGTLGGVVLALATTRFAEKLLYGVTPTDPATFIGVALVLLAVAALAAWLPARRAAKVDPMVALRAE